MVDIDIAEYRRKLEAKFQQFDRLGLSSPELRNEWHKNDENLAKIRGEILNKSLEVEELLITFLADYFCGRELDQYQSFRKNVLSMEYFTLYQKIVLFERVGYHKDKIFSNRYVGLNKKLLQIMEMRNTVAHGHKVHFTEPRVKVTKEKFFQLDENFQKEFQKNYDICVIALSELNSYQRKKNIAAVVERLRLHLPSNK